MPDTTAAKRRLIAIVRQRSFSTGGETKLVSGRSTSFYFDMKPSMLHPQGAELMAGLILEALEGDNVAFVGGMEIGAVPLAAAVAVLSQVRGRPLQAFFVRKQPKEHGARKLIEGLLEDVTTTGGSSLKAIEAARAAGATIARLVTVVDRLEGAEATFQSAAIPFTAILTAADFR
jgi:orotate phosphoribosyltransferase